MDNTSFIHNVFVVPMTLRQTLKTMIRSDFVSIINYYVLVVFEMWQIIKLINNAITVWLYWVGRFWLLLS